ncbi:UDP-N-acetylmuramoyl-tripeptide--D-alanyl-D-alanine ligase [Luminiphilus sp. nBUS_16]|uniref:UDP-N-acetylmuramoyl-tripeptide--D-alanyl-D- alanine ligase n=1 Tax=Luminiphilus sp. nBUS_16 TaxID=3395315 RepID=UPI003EB8440E
MYESAEQYLHSVLHGKSRNLARILEKSLTNGRVSEATPAHYALASALARAVHVIETDGSHPDEQCTRVLQSFSTTVVNGLRPGEDRDKVDAAQIAKAQYLTLARRQSIRLRAAALEAGQKLVLADLPINGMFDQKADSVSNTPIELSLEQNAYLLCLADLSTEAELEKARQLLANNVATAFSDVRYKDICRAYQWMGFAAVSTTPYAEMADDIAMQVLFQPSMLRRGLEEAPWQLLQQLFLYLTVKPSETLYAYAHVLLLEQLNTQRRLDTFKAAEANLPRLLLSIDVCSRALRAGQSLRRKFNTKEASPLSFLRASAVAKITGGVFSPPLKQDYAYPELTFSTSYLERTGIFIGIDSHWGFEPSNESTFRQAIKKGASLIIASDQNKPSKGQYLEVRNTFTALVKLALARRETFRGRVVGVTGSVGKTTVCSMITAMLRVQGEVYKNIANFNHQPGVPKSVANIPRSARYAVIEMGMGAKRTILPKALLVRPHTAVVTDIQADHMEFHESVASVVRTKMEVIWGVESGGTVVLNRDSEHFPMLQGLALQRSDINLLTVGQHPQANICAEDIELGPEHSRVQVKVFQKTYHYVLGLPGMHMALNSLMAVAVMVCEGVDLIQALPALEKLEPEKRRNQISEATTADGKRLRILDDSFNTNPASVRSNLHVLGLMEPGPNGRRILVLSDMGEMGSDARHYHTALAQDINDSRVDIFLSFGDHCQALDQLIHDRITHKNFESVVALEQYLHTAVRSGDIVSFKGSAREVSISDLVKNLTDRKLRSQVVRDAPTLVEFFNRRFKEDAYNLTKISEQEKAAISYLVQQAIALKKQQPGALWLIDYGCGDGRLQPFYNLLAETFTSTEFHILGADFAVEALKAYRTQCLRDGFEDTKHAWEIEGLPNDQRLASLKRGNINIHFLEGGVESLQAMICGPDQRFEILVAAGVLCRVLGDQCRREMLEAFSRVAASAFVSMPTQDEFKSLQIEFNALREERLQLLSQIESLDKQDNPERDNARQRLLAIEDILKDALVEGEIYYSARRVRGFGRKIPDLKDHKIPYFSATKLQAQQVIDYGGYHSTLVTHGAFGGHSRWMICLGSHEFSVDSVQLNSVEL